jgi:hypothetical protein
MRIGQSLRQLAKAELDLADEYQKVGQRQAAEHDVYHTCRSLEQQCLDHAARIAPIASRYQSSSPVGDEDDDGWSGIVASMRQRMSDVLARRPASGLVLLHDLRQLYHLAHEVSLHWTAVGQAAQAARDAELLDVTTALHEQTLTQIKWITTKLKEVTPQVLVVG